MADDGLSDTRLMEELRAGNDGALSQLIQRWQKPLSSFVFRYLQNSADTSEVVQETFVRVYQSRQRYRPAARFSTWLFTIAANLCRNRARWRKRHPSIPLEFEDPEREGAKSLLEMAADEGAETPHQSVEEQERAAAVREAVGELPHDLRTALLLFQFEHMSHQEIAAVAGCSPKAVETRLYRARQHLKKRLAWLLRDESGQAARRPEAV
jgi:RNA polymerase sigma-70 factor, ECF subfamily